MRSTVPPVLVLLAASCTGSIPGDARPPGGDSPAPVATSRPGGGSGTVDPPSSVTPPSVTPPPVTSAGCKAAEAGPAPLRRLTRRQYDKAVQRLFATKTTPADKFVEDERIEPFVSNLDASPTDGMIEQYLTAAEEMAAANAKKLTDALRCTAGMEADCGKRFIADFGRRAFRRPLTVDEAARYQKAFDDQRAAGLQAGVEHVVRTMLQSPNFLYHVESWGAPNAAGVARLDGHSLASRLAFFLTGAPPDDMLMAAAATGELADAAKVEAHARRLLGTADADEVLLDFHRHWLEIERMPRAEPDPKRYPEFTEALQAATEKDANAFLTYVFKSHGAKLDALFTLDHFVNAAGARVDLDPAQRAGILTHPALLTVSPRSVQRGRKVRELLLCQHVPPPPPTISAELPPAKPGQSPRQRWEAVMTNDQCAACHVRMNPIGFTFDTFDEIGRWRTQDEMLPIDTRGEIVEAGDASGKFDGAVALAKGLARSRAFHHCAAQQVARYALGRDLDAAETCGLEGITKRFTDAALDMRALMLAVATAPLFAQVKVLP